MTTKPPSKTETLAFRPYARLLTMLGDQLIKDEKTALLELIKNSYDADADWVQIRFIDFQKSAEDELRPTDSSFIEIEDNGDGMDRAILEGAWMNPATPGKKDRKLKAKRRTKKGRIIQGDKGIGRFSVLKLGRKIEIITCKEEHHSQEMKLVLDLSSFDSDFTQAVLKKPHEEPEDRFLYLDEIEAVISASRRTFFSQTEIPFGKGNKKRCTHGTLIRISGFPEDAVWTKDKLQEIQRAIGSLESPFERIHKLHKNPLDKSRDGGTLSGFEIDIVTPQLEFETESVPERFAQLIDKAIFVVRDGKFDQKKKAFNFELNDQSRTLSLESLEGYKPFAKQFITISKSDGTPEKKTVREPTCGNFDFEFFIFDFRSDTPPPKATLRVDREFIKKHRIYLYRDDVRVFPYGDAQDDWLQIDVLRGTGRAGDYLSNDQTVGCIRITQQGNPALEDKTSREGVIERGRAFADFVILIRSLLYFFRQQLAAVQFQRGQTKEQKGRQQIPTKLDELVSLLEKLPDKKPLLLAREIAESYRLQQKTFDERINLLQDLASVGISVETTSHDFAVILNQAEGLCDKVVKSLRKDEANVSTVLDSLVTLRNFIELLNDILVGIQPIFRVARQGPKKIRLVEQVKIVQHLFEKALSTRGIQCKITESNPLVVYATESIVLQTLINLFDNAIYWVALPSIREKQILIELDGATHTLRFSDSGPGVTVDTAPYIFEPFFSGKEEGRGLGLFVARSLLDRYGHTIQIATPSDTSLGGANFVIEFSPQAP